MANPNDRLGEREEQVLVLVKAVPRPSQHHGETVCCAGVTLSREWRRLYPVRFRQLKDNKFSRWQWVRYRWRPPTSDARKESRHIFEDSLRPGKLMPEDERTDFLEPLIVPSVKVAAARGDSLALIRPHEVRFRWKQKPEKRISAEKTAYESAAKQSSFFDSALAAIEPSPLEFRLSFRDEDGWHHHGCEDWETTATYWKFAARHNPNLGLKRLDQFYNRDYPAKGMVLAFGTMAKRPKTWLLLGVIRLDKPTMGSLFPRA